MFSTKDVWDTDNVFTDSIFISSSRRRKQCEAPRDRSFLRKRVPGTSETLKLIFTYIRILKST